MSRPLDKAPRAPSALASSSIPSNSKSSVLARVTPVNHEVFDPWNSASTGHQRAENPYSNTTAWRDTRTAKLSRQYRGLPVDSDSTAYAGATAPSRWSSGQNRTNETNGTKKRTGEWRWLSAEEAKREELGCQDIRAFMGGMKKRRVDPPPEVRNGCGFSGRDVGETEEKMLAVTDRCTVDRPGALSYGPDTEPTSNPTVAAEPQTTPDDEHDRVAAKVSGGIFAGSTFYINGSTMPTISDHKLKHVLATHGGRIAIGLARRTVTHVIVGKPNSSRVPGSGAGGGLAAGKLQKEIEKVRGHGVKFVGVEWALESIKAGKRLSEAKFVPLHMASQSQRSVTGMFKTAV